MVHQRAAGVAKHAFSSLESLALPHVCRLCGAKGDGEMDLCAGCRADLPWNRNPCGRCANPLPETDSHSSLCGQCASGQFPDGVDRILAPLVYDFPVDRLLLNLKFHEDLAAGRLLGELTALGAMALDRPVDCIVPVPLDWRRRMQRGFNQARELARPLSAHTGLPILDDMLRRRCGAEPQSTLPLEQRRRNIRGRFLCRLPAPARVALVDDVVTSGSTVAEAARELKKAGAEWVEVWACARTP